MGKPQGRFLTLAGIWCVLLTIGVSGVNGWGGGDAKAEKASTDGVPATSPANTDADGGVCADPTANAREGTVLQGLKGTLAQALPLADLSRPVAFGFGACWDVIVDAVALMVALGGEPDQITPRHHDEISSLKELAEVFAYFFTNGAAAERYVEGKQLFRRMVEVSLTLPHHERSVGGNAALMAKRMALEGATNVTLAFAGTGALAHEFDMLRVVGPGGITEDDVHLILEYKTGDAWGQFVSPRANRLALHSDVGNAELLALEPLLDQLKSHPPSTLVVGGLQLMQSYPGWDGGAWLKSMAGGQAGGLPAQAQDHPDGHHSHTQGGHDRMHPQQNVTRHPGAGRLAELGGRLLELGSRGTKVHFEFASISELAFMQEVETTVLQHSVSLGANEQELGILYEYLEHGKISHVQPHTPRVADTLDMMRSVYDKLRGRGLSRLHVHTLAYQAILCSGEWAHTAASMALASLTAGKWVCPGVEEDPEALYLILDESFSVSRSPGAQRMVFDDNAPVSCWEEDGVRICVSPNLVCKRPDKTIGAGDNISAAGLVLQL